MNEVLILSQPFSDVTPSNPAPELRQYHQKGSAPNCASRKAPRSGPVRPVVPDLKSQIAEGDGDGVRSEWRLDKAQQNRWFLNGFSSSWGVFQRGSAQMAAKPSSCVSERTRLSGSRRSMNCFNNFFKSLLLNAIRLTEARPLQLPVHAVETGRDDGRLEIACSSLSDFRKSDIWIRTAVPARVIGVRAVTPSKVKIRTLCARADSRKRSAGFQPALVQRSVGRAAKPIGNRRSGPSG